MSVRLNLLPLCLQTQGSCSVYGKHWRCNTSAHVQDVSAGFTDAPSGNNVFNYL